MLSSRSRVGVVLRSGTLESDGELAHEGKNVRRTKERWLSLQYEHPPAEVFQVSRFPGTRQHALLAIFQPPLRRFASWGELLRAHIGKWNDVQLLDGRSVVGFSVREENWVARLAPGVAAPKFEDAFGELQPVSDKWLRYLID